VRTYIVKAIPKQIRYAVSAGIGLFITLIGLANAKFIVSKGVPLLGMTHMDMIAITFIRESYRVTSIPNICPVIPH
jgi:AGZA family xanthine/uracil permease-like MFS transporter